MNSTPTEFLIAVILLTVALAMVVLFLRYKRAKTVKRMMAMLERAGLDPEIARQDDTRAIIDAVRRRCSQCQAEDICERWLDGEIKGSNAFCPNADIFRALARTRPRTT